MLQEVEQVKKIQEIVKEIRKQCQMLGGTIIYHRPFSELEERLVCEFPEPVSLTRVKFDEVEREGSLYIESTEGWNGVGVHTRGIPARIEVKGTRGVASFDETSLRHQYSGGKPKRKYSFLVYPAGRSKVVKKAKRIEYYVSPTMFHVRIE